MATKKTTKPEETTPVDEETESSEKLPTVEETREAELSDEELLADMPALRPPHMLRMRHRHAFLEATAPMMNSKALTDRKTKIDIADLVEIEGFLVAIDEFAESIALDRDAYEEWSIKNASNPEVFMALFSRYSVALGE